MAKLKPWYQVITPREDLRENRPMDASEFAVHLDHIRQKRENVSADYLDPARFFERTYFDRQSDGARIAGHTEALWYSGRDARCVQHGHATWWP
jgi:hypothetical protein